MNESARTDTVARPGADTRRTSAREEWMHEFRNALGNITIATSAASGQLDGRHDPVLHAIVAQIEEGCERCLRLLRTMPS